MAIDPSMISSRGRPMVGHVFKETKQYASIAFVHGSHGSKTMQWYLQIIISLPF